MSNLEMKVDALMRLVASEDGPFYDEAKAEVLRLMNGRSGGKTVPQEGIVEVIEDFLTEIGMPNHIKGFDYNVEAIRLAMKDKECVKSITKTLYPAIAEKFGTTASKTERAIRHGIELVWERGDIDDLNAYFGNSISYSKSKPTNSEFIARIAKLIRRRIESV